MTYFHGIILQFLEIIIYPRNSAPKSNIPNFLWAVYFLWYWESQSHEILTIVSYRASWQRTIKFLRSQHCLPFFWKLTNTKISWDSDDLLVCCNLHIYNNFTFVYFSLTLRTIDDHDWDAQTAWVELLAGQTEAECIIEHGVIAGWYGTRFLGLLDPVAIEELHFNINFWNETSQS